MLNTITCDTLGTMDQGAARAIIDAALRDAVRDLEDRGDDGKPRKVQITLTLQQLDNGQVATHLEAIAAVPKRRTAGTIAGIRRKAGVPELVFNDMAEDNPDQRTIDEVGGFDRREGERG